MKLPKPGKMKLPKPRADKPAGDKGDILSKIGGFRIKNRFLQKNLISLIVIAVLAIGTGTVYGTLSSRDADRGEDPVYGVNQDRYQVLVTTHLNTDSVHNHIVVNAVSYVDGKKFQNHMIIG